MDKMTIAARSALMSRIRSKDTSPEKAVRSLLHGHGYRFRLHRSDLPGKPDIVLPKLRKIILIQGCFWHGHTCSLASKPKSNSTYWSEKIKGNRARDRKNKRRLILEGWSVLELWECEIRRADRIEAMLLSFLGP
jgi:DNA mismatch endonuclease (patch repair protein)